MFTYRLHLEDGSAAGEATYQFRSSSKSKTVVGSDRYLRPTRTAR